MSLKVENLKKEKRFTEKEKNMCLKPELLIWNREENFNKPLYFLCYFLYCVYFLCYFSTVKEKDIVVHLPMQHIRIHMFSSPPCTDWSSISWVSCSNWYSKANFRLKLIWFNYSTRCFFINYPLVLRD